MKRGSPTIEPCCARIIHAIRSIDLVDRIEDARTVGHSLMLSAPGRGDDRFCPDG